MLGGLEGGHTGVLEGGHDSVLGGLEGGHTHVPTLHIMRSMMMMRMMQ